MSTSDDRVPFWLVTLVAGAATFALVATLGLLLLGPWRVGRRVPPPFPPELAGIQHALAEYLDEQGRFPSELQVTSAAASASRRRPTSLPRGPTTLPAAADVSVVAERIARCPSAHPAARSVTVRLRVANGGPRPATDVAVDVFGLPDGARVAEPFEIGDLPAGAGRELITTIGAPGRTGFVFRVRSAVPDPAPRNNRFVLRLDAAPSPPTPDP